MSKEDVQTQQDKQQQRWFEGVVWVALFGTLVLGLIMRWMLAGAVFPSWMSFRFFKHAHSHLGYFAVLFPLVWACWWKQEGFSLGKSWQLVYVLGVILSTVGFLRAGYAVDSILGSTVVLGVWLYVAWTQRALSMRREDWLSFAPLGIVLGAICIPPIAVLSRRDPGMAVLWVKTFLSLLIFLVMLPAVFSRLSFQAPPRWFWYSVSFASSCFLGIVPWPWLGVGLVGMGAWLLWALRKGGLSWDIRSAWVIWASSMILVGGRLVSYDHFLGIAGIHYTLLAPFFLSCWWIFFERFPPAWLRFPYLFFVLGMCAAIAGQSWFPHHGLWFSRASAVFGSLLVLWLVFLAGFVVRSRHESRGVVSV